MVKIVEEEEEKKVEERPNPKPTTSSSPPPLPSLASSSFSFPQTQTHKQDHLLQSQPSKPLPTHSDSPSSPSSISSDHTFHEPQQPSASPNSLSPPNPPQDSSPPAQPRSPAPVNWLIQSGPPLAVTKTEFDAATGFSDEADAAAANGGGRQGRGRRGRGSVLSFGRAKSEEAARRAALGFRVFEFAACLISFSVMVADRNLGWALDSFDRYKEFRYCMSVNVIGFAYSALQVFNIAHQLASKNQASRNRLLYCFDFVADQMLAYLLLSAASSAATRVDDWILNWGRDKFPRLASASIGMSLVAFVGFAISSLISGYLLSRVLGLS